MIFDNVTVATDPDWSQLDVQIKDFNGDSTLDVYLNILKTINYPKVIQFSCLHCTAAALLHNDIFLKNEHFMSDTKV